MEKAVRARRPTAAGALPPGLGLEPKTGEHAVDWCGVGGEAPLGAGSVDEEGHRDARLGKTGGEDAVEERRGLDDLGRG